MRALVNSFITELGRIEVRPQEEGRYAVNKINRAVSIKIAIEYSKIYNILVMKKRPETVSQRRRVDKTKSF